jgi:hypothetical protein
LFAHAFVLFDTNYEDDSERNLAHLTTRAFSQPVIPDDGHAYGPHAGAMPPDFLERAGVAGDETSAS